jgi:hypothetical protein
MPCGHQWGFKTKSSCSVISSIYLPAAILNGLINAQVAIHAGPTLKAVVTTFKSTQTSDNISYYIDQIWEAGEGLVINKPNRAESPHEGGRPY